MARHDGGMHIVAVSAAGGPTLLDLPVEHGDDPRLLLWRQGYTLVRYLSVVRTADDDLQVTAQVARRRSTSVAPKARRHSNDSRLEQVPLVVNQRVACYAIVRSKRGLLATRFALPGPASRTWGLPGGGRLPGENPADTVLREVREETSQEVVIDRLLDLQSDHWVGRSPRGVPEDFHALRIFYLATCPDPGDPTVIDVGGTTADARWVGWSRWRSVAWSGASRALLSAHAQELRG